MVQPCRDDADDQRHESNQAMVRTLDCARFRLRFWMGRAGTMVTHDQKGNGP